MFKTTAETFVPLKESSPIKRVNSSLSNCSSDHDVSIEHDGMKDTLDFRMQAVESSGKRPVSLWHDISLWHIDPETKKETEYVNFVCEIPKFSKKKYEIATDELYNPIKQDEKKGTLRELSSNLVFNYGCLPQTWEDPTFIHPDAEGCRGDNDPLDVCEIGARIIKPGQIRAVKVLGVICMIDEGECDWKVICIDKEDRYAPFLDDVDDVERELPGMLDAIREWYRTYKIPDGKPPNAFGLDERFMNKTYASEVIRECHHAWEELVSGQKERHLGQHDGEVHDLVRNLSKNSLFTLVDNAVLDEHPECHGDDFGKEESGALFF